MNSKQRFRSQIVLICVLLAALGLSAALYRTQIVKGASYAAKGNQQYVRPSGMLFDRGTIYFTSKDGIRIPAATIATGDSLYMNPSLITDPSQTYDILSQYLTLDRSSFLSKASKTEDHYEVLADRATTSIAASIQALELPGVNAVAESWRSYPGGSLAAHAIGLVGQNGSTTLTGQYGLEKQYEQTLSRSQQGTSVNALAGLFTGLRDSVLGGGKSSAGDIVTSIEPTVEAYFEKTLSDTDDAWHPTEIGGIVIDPQTGEIVAQASLPTFNPNNTSGIKDVSVFSDPIVEHVYEMGSIMKPLTMAMALDTGAEKADSTYDDVGCLTLDKKKICNYDGKARGVIPMQQILSQSLNIGAATIALKVGSTTMASYFSSFGLGEKTGVDLPNEATGILSNLKIGQDIDVATAAYGQGIAVSPLEMARALSILANGGYLVTPHLVKEIDYADGTTKTVADQKTGPIFKPQSVADVVNMLVTVVDKSLANGTIKMDHYTMAAKTGTAEIPDHVNGGYYADEYLHSFFGFFPAYKPRFLVFLYQVYPKGAQYASETLTNPYDQIAKFLINYYNIPPDR